MKQLFTFVTGCLLYMGALAQTGSLSAIRLTQSAGTYLIRVQTDKGLQTLHYILQR